MYELDEIDHTIINELRKNSKRSEQKLSRKTGIPMTTVHNRMRKLLENGVIENFTIRLNYKLLGRPLIAYVLLKAVAGADQKALLKQISALPCVFEVAMITGEFDLLFKARVESMEELNTVVVGGLRKQKTVGETQTLISYETFERV